MPYLPTKSKRNECLDPSMDIYLHVSPLTSWQALLAVSLSLHAYIANRLHSYSVTSIAWKLAAKPRIVLKASTPRPAER